MRLAFGFGIGLFVIASGCAPKKLGYVPKLLPQVDPVIVSRGEEKTLMPLVVGNQWTYALELSIHGGSGADTSETGLLVYKVTAANHDKNGARATVEMRQLLNNMPDKIIDTQHWVENDNGIFQTAVGSGDAVPFNPPQPVLLTPLADKKKFEYTGTGMCPDSRRGKLHEVTRVLDAQTVDTDEMGKMSALPIETTTDFVSYGDGKTVYRGTSISTTYFKPGTGIVRYHQEIRLGGQVTVINLRLRNDAIIRS